MATALEQSRERYARSRLAVPRWVPTPLTVPMSLVMHEMIEQSASALLAYHLARRAVRVGLADRTMHVGWVEAIYTVRDPDPDGEGTRGAVLIVPVAGSGVAFDLAHVRQLDECRELADRI